MKKFIDGKVILNMRKFVDRNKEKIEEMTKKIDSAFCFNLDEDEDEVVELIRVINGLALELCSDVHNQADRRAFNVVASRSRLTALMIRAMKKAEMTRRASILSNDSRRQRAIWENGNIVKNLRNLYVTANAYKTVKSEFILPNGDKVERLREGSFNNAPLASFSSIFVDIDLNKNIPYSREEIVERLNILEVKPTFIIATKHGLHAHFILRNIVVADDLDNCVRLTTAVNKFSLAVTELINSKFDVDIVDPSCCNSLGLTKIPFVDYQKKGEDSWITYCLSINSYVNLDELINLAFFAPAVGDSQEEMIANVKLDYEDRNFLASVKSNCVHSILSVGKDRRNGKVVANPVSTQAMASAIDEISSKKALTSEVALSSARLKIRGKGRYDKQWNANFDKFTPADEDSVFANFFAMNDDEVCKQLGVKQINEFMNRKQAQRVIRETFKFTKIAKMQSNHKFSSPMYPDNDPSAYIGSLNTNNCDREYNYEYLVHHTANRPSGDVIEMYRYQYNLSFNEALTALAGILGVFILDAGLRSDARVKALGYTKEQLAMNFDSIVKELNQSIAKVARCMTSVNVNADYVQSFTDVASAVIETITENHERMETINPLQLQTFASLEFIISKLEARGVNLTSTRVSGCLGMLKLTGMFRVVPPESIICKTGQNCPLTLELYPNTAKHVKSAEAIVGKLVAQGWRGANLLVGSNPRWSRRHVESILGENFVASRVDGVVVGAKDCFKGLATAKDNARCAAANRRRREAALAEADKPLEQRTTPVSFYGNPGKSAQVDAWANVDLDLSDLSVEERSFVAAAEQLERSRVAHLASFNALAKFTPSAEANVVLEALGVSVDILDVCSVVRLAVNHVRLGHSA